MARYLRTFAADLALAVLIAGLSLWIMFGVGVVLEAAPKEPKQPDISKLAENVDEPLPPEPPRLEFDGDTKIYIDFERANVPSYFKTHSKFVELHMMLKENRVLRIDGFTKPITEAILKTKKPQPAKPKSKEKN